MLGEYEFSVELDYDENMEELDVHCIESPKTDGKIVHSSSQEHICVSVLVIVKRWHDMV